MNKNNKKKEENPVKEKNYPAILEIIPIFLFFGLNRYFDIFVATGVLIVTSLINLVVGYLYTRSFHPISILTSILAVIFGGLTLFFHNESFIKAKVSIINICFALILLSGSFFKTNFLKMMLKSHVNMSAKGWQILSGYWTIFFIFLAVVNEIIWRNFSTDLWVNFKVFGILGLSMVFLLVQIPIIKKYKEDETTLK